MDLLLKNAAAVLIAVILGLVLAGQRKDISLLLSVAVCALVVTAAFTYLQPIIMFFEKLQTIGKLNGAVFNILLKSVGIGLLAELVSLICADSGNAALGKATQIMASGAILWLAVPLFEQLIKLIENILGAL